jgi:hypothetical protein
LTFFVIKSRVIYIIVNFQTEIPRDRLFLLVGTYWLFVLIWLVESSKLRLNRTVQSMVHLVLWIFRYTFVQIYFIMHEGSYKLHKSLKLTSVGSNYKIPQTRGVMLHVKILWCRFKIRNNKIITSMWYDPKSHSRFFFVKLCWYCTMTVTKS